MLIRNCFFLFLLFWVASKSKAATEKKYLVDSTSHRVAFVFGSVNNIAVDSAAKIFPFVISDSGSYKSSASNYYSSSFDSLHIAHIDFTSSSFFQTEKHKNEFNALRPALPEKWLFYFILLLTSVVVFVKTFFTKYFNEIWRSFFQLNFALQMMRQQDVVFSLPGILLSMNFYLVGSTFLFLNIHRQKAHILFSELWLIPTFFVVILFFVFFRFLVYRLSVLLFPQKSILQQISFLDSIHIEFAGIVLVPLVLLVAFASPILANIAFYSSALILLAIGVYRIITCWRIGGALMFNNLFHFILYICSVEIAPVLILLTLAQQWLVLK